jgi:hypothetical protein
VFAHLVDTNLDNADNPKHPNAHLKCTGYTSQPGLGLLLTSKLVAHIDSQIGNPPKGLVSVLGSSVQAVVLRVATVARAVQETKRA